MSETTATPTDTLGATPGSGSASANQPVLNSETGAQPVSPLIPVPSNLPPPTEDALRERLKEIYDPEIPINIVDLGLIYKVTIDAEGKVDVLMTLTSPFCPIGDTFRQRVEDALRSLPGVSSVVVVLTFVPAWNKDMLTADGKMQASLMGFM